jgi:hypothetical protein
VNYTALAIFYSSLICGSDGCSAINFNDFACMEKKSFLIVLDSPLQSFSELDEVQLIQRHKSIPIHLIEIMISFHSFHWFEQLISSKQIWLRRACETVLLN